jgi:hypothetical protein
MPKIGHPIARQKGGHVEDLFAPIGLPRIRENSALTRTHRILLDFLGDRPELSFEPLPRLLVRNLLGPAFAAYIEDQARRQWILPASSM